MYIEPLNQANQIIAKTTAKFTNPLSDTSWASVREACEITATYTRS
jgi:hypothetical protein